ncbi:glutathione S-transferase N-terminal domain-containing protein [Granulosicoccus sp.]|nr:glutathione S-transferase N-terminal domain-containing protein [Granulosicoccus sp.]MDB4222916.1 glutathione S-transferase N-terminal domain-containing protein [Granulosicoccus sp.]
MIDLYTWTTPNGRKVSILLEELGIKYKVNPIDITKNEQFGADFLAISPNNRIPAIVDHDTNISMMESGAIMQYLAEKTGMFLSTDPTTRWATLEWLNWQMGGLGPMAGQTHHFVKYNPGKSQYAEERYQNETRRLYGVLEKQLTNSEYIAGEYSIADMACWPWISRFEWQGIDLTEFKNLKRWYLTIAGRPAVQKGYQIPKYVSDIPMP